MNLESGWGGRRELESSSGLGGRVMGGGRRGGGRSGLRGGDDEEEEEEEEEGRDARGGCKKEKCGCQGAAGASGVVVGALGGWRRVMCQEWRKRCGSQ